MSNLQFDATGIDPQQAYEVVPPGEYLVEVTSSAVKPTKNNTGEYLELELTIVGGSSMIGRKLWDRITLTNNNPQAVEIGKRQLSGICHAAGRLQVRDSSELHGIPVIAVVKVKPAGQDTLGNHRDASNEVKAYKPANGNAPASQPVHAPPANTYQAQTTAAPAAAAARPAATVPPWKAHRTA